MRRWSTCSPARSAAGPPKRCEGRSESVPPTSWATCWQQHWRMSQPSGVRVMRFNSLDEWMFTDVRGWTLAQRVDDDQFARLSRRAAAGLTRHGYPKVTPTSLPAFLRIQLPDAAKRQDQKNVANEFAGRPLLRGTRRRLGDAGRRCRSVFSAVGMRSGML